MEFAKCDNCETTTPVDELNEVKRYAERVDGNGDEPRPGEGREPAGECPACGALAYPLECIDGPRDCAGDVEWRTTPDRTDGKHFQRCEFHFDKRMASVERTLELTSPSRPSWFDESYAGERWDEDV